MQQQQQQPRPARQPGQAVEWEAGPEECERGTSGAQHRWGPHLIALRQAMRPRMLDWEGLSAAKERATKSIRA